MDKKFAIFDMDGTLVDSMIFWRCLASEFLHNKGIANIPADLSERIKPMTITESAELFQKEFGLSGTPETIAAEMNGLMSVHYCTDIPLKSGIKEYLNMLHQNGVRMCVASATAGSLMQACLDRLDVLNFFDFLLSCEEVGAGKTKPDIYFAAARRLGAVPADIAVYEDALYAVRTAKEAGFYTVGVYDESAGNRWPEIIALSDEAVRRF